ncbi:MAG: leucine-rich repeat protein [Clostridia bacterium]|nr:leucine-rich repeat protein [Clostridia bacterium]
MRKKRILGIFIILTLAIFASIFCACRDSETENYYTIMIPDGVGYSVIGEKVKKVNPNASVEFDVVLDEGYEFIGSSVGEYADGKLRIDKAEFSATVDFKARLSKEIADIDNGFVKVTPLEGDKPQYGELVDFQFTPYENYVVEEVYLDGQPYAFVREANGSVIVRAKFDEYVSLKAVCLGRECNLTVDPVSNGRLMMSDFSEGVRYGDVIEVVCAPDSGYKFAYIERENGERIFLSDYTFTVMGDTRISAKFFGVDALQINYDFNGADSSIGTGDFAYAGENIYLDNAYGKWMKSGYTLVGWNTKPDGSGKRHALGAMINMPQENITLYAQYQKQTDENLFGYSDFISHNGEEGYQIVSFNGDVRQVVIPDTYNGKKVFAIGMSVFHENRNIESITLNSNIEFIGAYAFASMNNLKEIYLYDSIRDLSSTAFYDSDNLSYLHMNSASRRVYEQIIETSLVDKQMRVQTSEGKKIVTISGCSLARGMKSEMFVQDEVLGEYDVIHMGVHARYGAGILMDLVNNYLNDGDILIFALENYDEMWMNELGINSSNSNVVQKLSALESNYDLYEEFDLAESKGRNEILPYLSRWFELRTDDLDNDRYYSPWMNRNTVNKYGDYTYFRPNATEDSLSETYGPLFTNLRFLDDIYKINNWAQKHISNGVKVAFIYPPIYRYKAYDDPENKAEREAFEAKLKETLVFPVLGGIDDICQPYYNMADLVNHMSTEGTAVYTATFIDLLKTALTEGAI